MTLSAFIKYLIYATIVSIVLFYVTNFMWPISMHQDLLWWSILCFVLLAVIIYFLVDRSMTRSGGKGMIGLVIFNVLLKLVFSFGFVAFYVKSKQPQDKAFIVPFLITYLVFTIFETWFLNEKAREVK